MKKFLNKLFKLDQHGTTVKTEIIAGITTFFAMCYIIVVNPNQMIGTEHPALWNACFVGGIIAGVVATICMAFIANKPFALAAGMGLNSFFFVSFILPNLASPEMLENGYQAGLSVILMSGIIFLILSFTGARSFIAKALPQSIKVAVPAGIGLFIAFIGLQNAGIVSANPYTCVALADLTQGANVIIPVTTAFLGFILIIVFGHVKVNFLNKASIILGILAATIFYYAASFIFIKDYVDIFKSNFQVMKLDTVFSDWAHFGLVGGIKGFKFVFDGTTIGSIFTVIMLVITYCLVDMFDTLGTIYGTSIQAEMIDENGDPENLSQCMLADSIGTVAGSLTGTSTITTFVESSSGVAAGGRTGLTSFITAILFLVCLFFAPIASIIPSAATAPALMFVGLLMFKNIVNIDFKDLTTVASAFTTLFMMVVTYSISNGIILGSLVYVILTLLTGKYSKKDIVVTIIAIIGVLKLLFVSM